jgi:GNAT superfamily N-acetyltransferase
MLHATTVTTPEELEQIYRLNRQNLKQHMDADTRAVEGFVSWLYSPQLLQQMHALAPSIIVKDNDEVVAYALTTLKEAASFHADLATMFNNLRHVQYRGRPLSEHSFYCIGQICVAKSHRGQGLVNLLYQKHREEYAARFPFVLTEISTGNPRSLKAHEKTGFITIHTYEDQQDQWNVVVWEF